MFDGLYAAGEAAGFGGGGVHGYRSLEGTFLGGCVFSGRAAGRAAARTSRGPGRAADQNSVPFSSESTWKSVSVISESRP